MGLSFTESQRLFEVERRQVQILELLQQIAQAISNIPGAVTDARKDFELNGQDRW